MPPNRFIQYNLQSGLENQIWIWSSLLISLPIYMKYRDRGHTEVAIRRNSEKEKKKKRNSGYGKLHVTKIPVSTTKMCKEQKEAEGKPQIKRDIRKKKERDIRDLSINCNLWSFFRSIFFLRKRTRYLTIRKCKCRLDIW